MSRTGIGNVGHARYVAEWMEYDNIWVRIRKRFVDVERQNMGSAH
jgi:hypothetical protein